MRTAPIDSGNTEQAIALLAKGFPGRTQAFWAAALERILKLHASHKTGAPGELLMKGERPVGVLLKIASHTDGGKRRTINLSSWYVEPDCRWFAPRMLQKATSDETATYTDFTASPETFKLNERLGFQLVSKSILLFPLPWTAVASRSCARMLKLSDVPADALPQSTRLIMKDHEALGCIITVMFVDGKYHPLVFVAAKTKGLPSARLIYCENISVAVKNTDIIAKFLLGHGKLFLTMPATVDEKARGGIILKKFAPTQVKGEWKPDYVNQTYSELVILPL